MLYSFLVSITSTNENVITNPLGRPAQAWFLGRLESLGIFLEQLHKESLIPIEEQGKVTEILKLLYSIHRTESETEEPEVLQMKYDNKISYTPLLNDIHQAEENLRIATTEWLSIKDNNKSAAILYWLNNIHKAEKNIEKELLGRNHKNHLRPYTSSTLLYESGQPVLENKHIRIGETYVLRFTTLVPLLSEIARYWVFQDEPDLLSILPSTAKVIKNQKQYILEKYPSTIRLYKLFFSIDSYTFSVEKKGSWGMQSSYSDFSQDNTYANSSNKLLMEFLTPTAFRKNGYDIVAPEPGQIFRNLWEKWNAFCPDESMQLDFRWPEFARDCILVDTLTTINSTTWIFADGIRGSATGFSGIVGFKLLPKEAVKKQWQPIWHGARAVMWLLARYAYFCGVGHHSTIGMGQCRVLGEKESPIKAFPRIFTRK